VHVLHAWGMTEMSRWAVLYFKQSTALSADERNEGAVQTGARALRRRR